MPCVIICTKPDGSVYLNSMPDDQAAQFEQDAVPAKSLDEALQMAKDVLTEGETPQQEAQEPAGEDANEGNGGKGGDNGGMPPPAGAEGMPLDTPDQQMAAGFKRAKRGY